MKTTFSRILFSAILVLLVALLVIGISFQALVRNYLKDQAMENLKNDGAIIAQLASAYYSENRLSDQEFLLNLTVASGVSDADAVICNTEGTLILCSGAPMGCPHQGMTIEKRYLERIRTTGSVESTGMIRNLYSDPRYIVGLPVLDNDSGAFVGIVLISTPIADTDLVLRRLLDFYLLISVIVILAAISLMIFVLRRQSSPLRDMARVASAFGHGDLQARAKVDPSDPQEVQELALSFNNMASSLQKGEYQRQEFVANVSHELKTPMTTIGGYVDGILDGTIPPEKHTQYLTLVSGETKRLNRLVRSMLDISRIQEQGGIPEERKTRFDLTECVGQVLISFEDKILSKKLSVQVQMPEHAVYTRADSDAITQVVYNLVDNAVKFCPEEGTLELCVQEGDSKLYLSVANDGPVIPPEELDLVFDRFHKMDKSRSQNRDGWGLGLYIVKALICSHGEDISVTSSNGKTEFTFTLPLVN